MRLVDIVKMAVHNMRRRPVRSFLNLLGIVLGTATILMTTAGTDGVKTALNSLFENSELTRKVIVRRGSTINESMLEPDAWKIKGEMSDQRRTRLENSLKEFLLEELRAKKGRHRRINTDVLSNLEDIENVNAAVPRVWLRFLLEQNEYSTSTIAEGVAPNAAGLSERIVAGQMIQDDDVDGVLIHELLAHQMGYTTKPELDALIGKEVDVTFEQGSRGNNLVSLFIDGNKGKITPENLQSKAQILKALGTLVENLDLSSLNEEQKNLIQKKFKPAVETKNVQSLTVKKKFVITGIYHSLEEDFFSIFDEFAFDSSRPVLFHYKTATDLQVEVFKSNDFYTASVLVDSYHDIDGVEKEITAMGFKTVSVKGLLKKVEERIDEIGRVIYVIALIILLMTVFAICNTLIVSVMERTSEFGIMKSLGAKDRHVVGLMLIEGALMGVIGAGIAIGGSLLLAKFGQGWLRQYVEGRVNQTLSGDVFSFSTTSVVIAFFGAILICCLASIIPAWRAAKLDPIVAMQRK